MGKLAWGLAFSIAFFAALLAGARLPKPNNAVSITPKKAIVMSATQAPQNDVVNVDVWLDGLDMPWSLVFTSMEHALVTEKAGLLYEVLKGKRLAEPVGGTPTVNDRGQGGLLDVAIDPDYKNNAWVYLSYSHPLEADFSQIMTKVVRGRIKDGVWRDEQVLFSAKPQHYLKSGQHFGSRITFDGKGHMFFSIGDRGHKDMAQDITRPNGKIHRLHHDGRVPKGNPFVGREGAYASIFSYGHRNPQGLVYSDGRLWSTEHGPKGGDELNNVLAGANYGWPRVSYGRNYSGTELTPYSSMEGMESPMSQWTPSIAACGLAAYSGNMFSDWNGYLLAGALKYEELRLIKLVNGQYQSEQIILKNKGRVRAVATGLDGAIYVTLNQPDQILRLTQNKGKESSK